VDSHLFPIGKTPLVKSERVIGDQVSTGLQDRDAGGGNRAGVGGEQGFVKGRREASQMVSTVRPIGVEQPLVCLGFLLVANAGVRFKSLPVEDRELPPTVTNHACFL